MLDTAPYSFQKCVSDRAVYNWGDNVQQEIFLAAMDTVELTALKLKVLKSQDSSFASGAPAEVAQSRTLSESLHHYASVNEV